MQTRTMPIEHGERVYFVGHSFHMFVVRPLIQLAKEAGIKGHWAEGWDMIGGSTPMQHWERGGDQNAVKRALASGRVQVLTLSTNIRVPEPAVDLFADLAVEHNPDVRVMLQHSWGDGFTGSIMRVRHDAREAGQEMTREEVMKAFADSGYVAARDQVTADELAEMRREGRLIDQWRAQLAGINRRHGRTLAYIVPVNDAVLRARQAILEATLPGVERQSQLFRDMLGHASQVTMDLVSYAWFGALYRRSPIGLGALVQTDDPAAPARHRRLQELAWSAVLDEPMSGVEPE